MDDRPNEDIATWVRADASRPYCARPWRQVTVLSDGTAVCACIDANKQNPLGDFRVQSFDEIWNGPAYEYLRRSIAADIDRVPVCVGCPNRVEGPPPPADYMTGVAKPHALFIESYAGCNLVCPGCDREGIEGGRDSLSLDWDTYVEVIDQLSPTLEYMEFHVGGENYMHKRADDMVRYCKDKNPGCFVLSSTNGHFFHTEDRVRSAIESGIDCFIFSVDGATQKSYEKYRVNGRLDRVLDAMRAMVAMRDASGRDRPIIVWRYILFAWNDGPEEMDLARKMAKDIGVDHLAWHLNGVDDQHGSDRYHVGSPHLHEIRDELWDTILEREPRADVTWDMSRTYR